jgi:hypothetical protein
VAKTPIGVISAAPGAASTVTTTFPAQSITLLVVP